MWHWPDGVRDGNAIPGQWEGQRPICPPEIREALADAREIRRFARTCIHWRGLTEDGLCGAGVEAKEVAGAADMPRQKSRVWWSHSPCVAAEGCRSCERYEPPTEDAVLDYCIRREVERQERRAARMAEEEGKQTVPNYRSETCRQK